jgi:hypothetical protein
MTEVENMIYLDVTKGLNHIGRLGENEHRTLRFRESAEILTLYPDAVVTVLHKRPGDLAAYPVAAEYVDVSSGMVCWTIQSGDLARVGRGKVELVFSEGDVIAKSYIYDTFVEPALNGSENPPDPWRTWIDGIMQGVQDADNKITNLEESIDESLDEKADKYNPVFTGALSHGRKESTHVGFHSLAYGQDVTATGFSSQAMGNSTTASGDGSHAEGSFTIASGVFSHAEGIQTNASGTYSHAEGMYTEASGLYSHAEGFQTVANAVAMHAQGARNAPAEIFHDWVGSTQYAVGARVKRNGSGFECLVANNDNEFIPSKWKSIPGDSMTAFAVGNGVLLERSNAFEVQWDGTAIAQKAMQIGGTRITEAQLQALLALLS